jgi:hypothetical protein
VGHYYLNSTRIPEGLSVTIHVQLGDHPPKVDVLQAQSCAAGHHKSRSTTPDEAQVESFALLRMRSSRLNSRVRRQPTVRPAQCEVYLASTVRIGSPEKGARAIDNL